MQFILIVSFDEVSIELAADLEHASPFSLPPVALPRGSAAGLRSTCSISGAAALARKKLELCFVMLPWRDDP